MRLAVVRPQACTHPPAPSLPFYVCGQNIQDLSERGGAAVHVSCIIRIMKFNPDTKILRIPQIPPLKGVRGMYSKNSTGFFRRKGKEGGKCMNLPVCGVRRETCGCAACTRHALTRRPPLSVICVWSKHARSGGKRGCCSARELHHQNNEV